MHHLIHLSSCALRLLPCFSDWKLHVSVSVFVSVSMSMSMSEFMSVSVSVSVVCLCVYLRVCICGFGCVCVCISVNAGVYIQVHLALPLSPYSRIHDCIQICLYIHMNQSCTHVSTPSQLKGAQKTHSIAHTEQTLTLFSGAELMCIYVYIHLYIHICIHI